MDKRAFINGYVSNRIDRALLSESVLTNVVFFSHECQGF